jgi:hypothetical protein
LVSGSIVLHRRWAESYTYERVRLLPLPLRVIERGLLNTSRAIAFSDG